MTFKKVGEMMEVEEGKMGKAEQRTEEQLAEEM